MPTALITGGTSGLGYAFAKALASEGNDIVLVARDEQRLRRVASALAATYGVTTSIDSADLARREDVERIEALVTAERVDILINNAGFGTGASFLDNDLATEQRSLDVLITAVLRLTYAALKPMVERGSGEVVSVSSVSGFLARGTYGAHKAWVIRFSRSMNAQYGTRDLRLMAVCPGFVRTEFHARLGADTRRIPNWMWLDADQTVREALGDLRRGKAVSIPTRRWRLLTRASQLVPDRQIAKFAKLGR